MAAHLARITLREGDRVQAGDPVAVLTPVMSSMVDERSAREAGARLQAAGAGLTRAVARVERARIALDEARLDQERTERLAQDGFVSPARLDATRLALAGARRELDIAQAERQMAVHEQTQAAAALEPASLSGRSGRPLLVRSPVAGAVLVSPYDSLAAIGRHHYPWLPVGLLLRHRFDPAADAAGSTAPLLALVAAGDAIIPVERSRALYDAWAGPKQWLAVTGADHNTLGATRDFWDPIARFLAAVPPR